MRSNSGVTGKASSGTKIMLHADNLTIPDTVDTPQLRTAFSSPACLILLECFGDLPRMDGDSKNCGSDEF